MFVKSETLRYPMIHYMYFWNADGSAWGTVAGQTEWGGEAGRWCRERREGPAKNERELGRPPPSRRLKAWGCTLTKT